MSADELDEATVAAWADLEERLTHHLESVVEHQVLLLELPSPYDDEAGASPYVQFCVDDEGGVRAEVSSNAYLDARLALDLPRMQALGALGWEAPTCLAVEKAGNGSANFHRDAQLSGDAGLLASMAVGALRDVFGVPHPAFLTASGLGPKATFTQVDLDLGLDVVQQDVGSDDELGPMDGPVEGALAVVPRDGDHLRTLVDAAIAHDIEGAVDHDADGDVPVRSGSAMVFVRVDDESPVIEVFSPLLTDVVWSTALDRRLTELNSQGRFAKLTYADGAVLLGMNLFAYPFLADHVRHALSVMCTVADELDGMLHQEFGGRTFFGEYQPPPGNVGPNGGYL